MQLIEKVFLVIFSISGAIANLNITTSKSTNEMKLSSKISSFKSEVLATERTSLPQSFPSTSVPQDIGSRIHEENRTPAEYHPSTTVNFQKTTENIHILKKIHRTLTRSKDAIWATITLTFICVLLVISVAQSQMWKNYHGPESQGVPLPNFNERVLFKDVMEHKMKSFKKLFPKQKKPKSSELESLLQPGDWADDSTSIPIDSS